MKREGHVCPRTMSRLFGPRKAVSKPASAACDKFEVVLTNMREIKTVEAVALGLKGMHAIGHCPGNANSVCLETL